MCGIMGYYCFSGKRPQKDKISDLFSLLQSRGTDASGFAFIKEGGGLIVHKAPIRSSEMVKTKEWKDLSLPKAMILHTRMKTQGTEKNNANNHPLFSKNGYAIVHNGIVYNDKEIIGKRNRDAEVDSEAILSLISIKTKGDNIKRLFDKIEGSFAVAAVSSSEPNNLMLIKKDNPIQLYYNSEDDIFYFSSERERMQESLEIKAETKRGFNMGEGQYHFYEMENNHALILNPEGVESYKRYYPKRSSWWDRGFGYKPDDTDMIVECPWCFQQTHYYDGKLFNKCEQCGMGIDEEDLYNVI